MSSYTGHCAVRCLPLSFLLLLLVCAAASAAENACEVAEAQIPFAVGEWVDLGIGVEGWWLEGATVEVESRAAHSLEGAQEAQLGYEMRIQHVVLSDEPLLGEIEVEWRDAAGAAIGSTRARVLLDAQSANGEPLSVWLRGSEYGLQRATGLIVRMRTDAEIPQLQDLDELPTAPYFEEMFAPLDPGPFGVDAWRNFECGFGLPPICETCNALGQQCYEVDIAITGTTIISEPYCATPITAAAKAEATCLSKAIGVGFFCRRPSYRRAQLRHSCDYPHLRYPYGDE